MNRYYGLIVLSLVYSSCIHSSSQPSSPEESFRINYYGTINGRDVEYINISGLTENIVFYEKPDQQNKNPQGVSVKKDLSDISTIILPEGGVRVSKYDGTEYVEIIVRDNVGNSRTLLIPKTKKISGKEKDNSWTEVDFQSLNKLEIKGASCKKKSESKA